SRCSTLLAWRSRSALERIIVCAPAAASRPITAITTSNSSRVKPLSAAIPVAHITVFSLATLAVVRAKGEHVHLSMFSRQPVAIRPAPGIDQMLPLPHIGPPPFRNIGRRLPQCLQAVLHVGIGAGI